MEPAWARRFELPSITGYESVGTCRTLLDLYLATGTKKYLKAAGLAVQWFQKSSINKNKWGRFYELKTNLPFILPKATCNL